MNRRPDLNQGAKKAVRAATQAIMLVRKADSKAIGERVDPRRTSGLSSDRRDKLLGILAARFEKNRNRHPGLVWADVQASLAVHPDKLWSVSEMERTGGEPDVVGQDRKTGEFLFCDCSAESPAGRREFCPSIGGRRLRRAKQA